MIFLHCRNKYEHITIMILNIIIRWDMKMYLFAGH